MPDKEYYKHYRQEYSKRVKYLNVSVPIKTFNEMQARADKEGTKVSKLFRDMAIAYMQQKTFVPKEIEDELKQVRLLIRNIANNVNQVAHHSNIMKGLVEDNELLSEIKKLEAVVDDYTKKRLKGFNDY
jgi:hypothetical protein